MKCKAALKWISVLAVFALVLGLFLPLASFAAPLAPDQNAFNQRMAALARQAQATPSEPQLHDDLKAFRGEKQVNVIVHLSKKPVGLEIGLYALQGKTLTAAKAGSIEAGIRTQQADIKTAMKNQGIAFSGGTAFSNVLNGFSASVKAEDLNKLLAIDGVTFVEPDIEVHAAAAPSPQQQVAIPSFVPSTSFLGVEKLWQEGLEGQGVKIAVLDTGIDKDHPEFAQNYKGGKNFVPFSPHFTKPRLPDDASETRPSERAPNMPKQDDQGMPFETFHGTHVAGTIAAGGANGFGFKGIAPKADIYAYRVLGAYSTGSMSWVIAGIEEAVKQKMDIINLSLAGYGTSETDVSAYALNNAMLAGTIAVSAAGNAGQFRGSIGIPATSSLGIAVGNSTTPEERYSGAVKLNGGAYTFSKVLNVVASTTDKEPATQLAGEYEAVAILGAGTQADYQKTPVEGKVAVVALGQIPIHDKIKNAKEQGAKAVLLHNIRKGFNAPGPSEEYLGDSLDYIPAFDLSQTDGEAIRKALAAGGAKVSFSGFKLAKTNGDDLEESSSNGPTTPNFDIKPDVVAPGTSIMSVEPMYKAGADYSEAYVRMTGTSMAAPHVTGVAALIKQAYPEWSPFDVKVALSNTARLLDDTKYDVFMQGAGRVQAYNAARPEFLAYSYDQAVQNGPGTFVENIKGTISFGSQPLKSKDISVTKKLVVKDRSGKGGEVKVTVDTNKTFGGASVTVDKPSFTLSGEQVLNLTLKAAKNANVEDGAEIQGYVHVTKGKTDISLPFAADFTESGIVEYQHPAISETDLSFNGDGINDRADLTFNVTDSIGKNSIELRDLVNPSAGAYGDGYIGHLRASDTLAAGKYTIPLDGSYLPWNGEPQTKIPDGLYLVDLMGEPANRIPPFIFSSAGPIIVKSTAPKISGTVIGEKMIGRVIDKYIDYNNVLQKQGEPYNLNDKLNASYTINGSGDAIPFVLDQNGAFEQPLENFKKGTDFIAVTVTDAAGNKAQAEIR